MALTIFYKIILGLFRPLRTDASQYSSPVHSEGQYWPYGTYFTLL